MAKISYGSLKLKVKNDTDTFEFGGKQVEVLKYLPAPDKYDLIHVSLQKSKNHDTGLYDEFLLDVFFHLNLVYMYTNLTFTENQRDDELKIYDCFKSNGFFDAFLKVMPEEEYNELWEMMNLIKAETVQYESGAAAVLKKFVTDLPANAEAAANFMSNFKEEDYQHAMQFANAIGFDPTKGKTN